MRRTRTSLVSSDFLGARRRERASAAGRPRTAFDGTYALSLRRMSRNIRGQGWAQRPVPGRRTGRYHVEGRVQYTTVTGHQLRGTVGPQGQLTIGRSRPKQQQRRLPAGQSDHVTARSGAPAPPAPGRPAIPAATISSGKRRGKRLARRAGGAARRHRGGFAVPCSAYRGGIGRQNSRKAHAKARSMVVDRWNLWLFGFCGCASTAVFDGSSNIRRQLPNCLFGA